MAVDKSTYTLVLNPIDFSSSFASSDNDQKWYENRQKEIDEGLRKYEPYDTNEIVPLFQEAMEFCKSIKNQKKLISRLALILNKMNLIINNAKAGFQYLQNMQSTVDPLDFDIAIEQAENLKKQLLIKMQELNPAMPQGSDISKLDPNKPTINIRELSDALGFGYSVSKIEKEGYTLIPRDCFKKTNPKVKKKQFVFITEKVIAWMKAGMSPPNETLSEKSENNQKEKTKDKHHFIFNISLEPLTNVLVEKGYLDKDNAALMNTCFSKEAKPRRDKIKWRKEANSLLTFIYLSDKLDYIDRSSRANFKDHYTSSNKTDKSVVEEEKPEVKFQKFVNEYFEIENGGISNPTLSREWKKIDEAVFELCKKVYERIKKPTTRTEAIKYYFENKENKSIRLNSKKDEEISIDILEIMSSIYEPKQKMKVS